MACLKNYRDSQVHIECGAVLLADQNAHIFDDLKLQITSFNGTEGSYVFSNKTRVSFNCGIFYC